ncbi:MAG TPA: BTAD domain-containing putative transcriptional regulator, partial [Actinopolymorphaceae bacterium]
MRFCVLGRLRIVDGDRELSLSAPKTRRLLAVLLAHAGQAVPADILAETLWPGEDVDRVLPRLHLQVHRLRRALDGLENLTHAHGTYTLDVCPGDLDTREFESLVTESEEAAARHDLEAAAAHLRRALTLWQGRPFEDFEDIDVVRSEASRLTELEVAAREELYALELARGRQTEILDELREFADRHPLRERSHLLLMATLAATGRRGEAATVFDAVRERMAEELGLEPGTAITEMAEVITAGKDPRTLVRHATGVDEAQSLAVFPPAPAVVGRQAELEHLDRLATESLESGSNRLVVVSGMPGVGKTALVVHWAHRSERLFPDGRLYVDLRGFSHESAVPAGEVLPRFLTALGAVDVPTSEAEQISLYRSTLAHRRVLVVLDNAADPEQVRPLLPGGSAAMVVVTSRDELRGLVALDDAVSLRLPVLDRESARQLVTDALGAERSTEPALVDGLAEACGRLPLALSIAAASVASDEKLDLADVVRTMLGGQGVGATFDQSYARLDEDGRLVFRRCGLVPARSFSTREAAAAAGLELPRVRRALRRLVTSHLVEPYAPERYRLHDLVRAYAEEMTRREDSAREREQAVGRILDRYLAALASARRLLWPGLPAPEPVYGKVSEAPEFADRVQARQWLDREYPDLIAAIVHLAPHPRTVELARGLRVYFDTSSDVASQIAAGRSALDTAHRLGNAAAEAAMRRLLAKAYLHAGDFETALEHARAATVLADPGGQRERIVGHSMVGEVLLALGRSDEARRHLDAAVRLSQRQSGVYQIEPLLMMAGLARASGDAEEALRLTRRGLHLTRLYRSSAHEADALTIMAEVYVELHEDGLAAECAAEALRLHEQAGRRRWEARTLGLLADLRTRAGDVEGGRRYAERAESILEAVGHLRP